MTAAEECVRSHWKDVELEGDRVFVCADQHHPITWEEAEALTKERLKAIQEVKDEIQSLVYHAVFPVLDDAVLDRILTREWAVLRELERGMKGDTEL